MPCIASILVLAESILCGLIWKDCLISPSTPGMATYLCKPWYPQTFVSVENGSEIRPMLFQNLGSSAIGPYACLISRCGFPLNVPYIHVLHIVYLDLSDRFWGIDNCPYIADKKEWSHVRFYSSTAKIFNCLILVRINPGLVCSLLLGFRHYGV